MGKGTLSNTIQKVRVVVDTNILLQAIAHDSRLRPIWKAFLNQIFELYLTASILLEYEEIFLQKASETASTLVLTLIDKAPNAHFISVYYNWNAITADANDNKFFDAAVAASADYLVTNDGHFNEVKNLSFPKVTILSADEFLQLLEGLPQH